MPALHHAEGWAKLMACWGDKETLLGKLGCTRAWREKLAGSCVRRAGQLLAVAALMQMFPDLRGQGKTAEKWGAQEQGWPLTVPSPV